MRLCSACADHLIGVVVLLLSSFAGSVRRWWRWMSLRAAAQCDTRRMARSRWCRASSEPVALCCSTLFPPSCFHASIVPYLLLLSLYIRFSAQCTSLSSFCCLTQSSLRGWCFRSPAVSTPSPFHTQYAFIVMHNTHSSSEGVRSTLPSAKFRFVLCALAVLCDHPCLLPCTPED